MTFSCGQNGSSLFRITIPDSGEREKILVCPLNWGLGHASRCVPLIRGWLTENKEVVILADGYPLELLRFTFPALRVIEYPSYDIHYSRGASQLSTMLIQSPKILWRIFREHIYLRQLLKREHFDQVVSDNRFGMWSTKVYSVYITHQLMIKMPRQLRFLERFISRLHHFFINQYDECWIPDTDEEGGLSGDLSHKYPLPLNARCIGSLSRFKDMTLSPLKENYDIVAVVSGPEPQRSLLENQLISRFENQYLKTLIVQGKPQKEPIKSKIGTVQLISHLSDNELGACLRDAKKIICRSGYSGIMDLHALGCLSKTEFIPTPGQTEQEYLAKWCKKFSK